MPTMELPATRDAEQRVLEAVRAGDEQAFTDLVEPYRRRLHADQVPDAVAVRRETIELAYLPR